VCYDVAVRADQCERLFKYELTFRADATFDQIFDDTVAEMIADREIARIDQSFVALEDALLYNSISFGT
jgi:hypothetical protein